MIFWQKSIKTTVLELSSYHCCIRLVVCVTRALPNSSFTAETVLRRGWMKGSPCWSSKKFSFTDEGYESYEHCPKSFTLVDRTVESKSTSQHVVQGCTENTTPKPTGRFFLVSKAVVSLTSVFRYYVNRDTLFCYHRASEVFLQRLMALYVASHYKVKLVLLLSKF